MKKSGLEDLEKTANEFISRFDQLTGVQKRSFIERMIAKVRIRKDNKIELHVLWNPNMRAARSRSLAAHGMTGAGSIDRTQVSERKTPLEGIDTENIYGDLKKDKKKAVTRTTISSIRKENGGFSRSELELLAKALQVAIMKELSRRLLLSSKAFLTEFYVEKGYSAAQIAREILSSKSGVLDALRRFEIPVREAHKPHGRQSQAKFGEKRKHGTIHEHKIEKRTVTVINKLRDEGMTLRKIAEVLTTMGISTKCRGQKWHPEMIRRILSATTKR